MIRRLPASKPLWGALGRELKSPGCKLLKFNMEPKHETLEEEKHVFFLTLYRF